VRRLLLLMLLVVVPVASLFAAGGVVWGQSRRRLCQQPTALVSVAHMLTTYPFAFPSCTFTHSLHSLVCRYNPQDVGRASLLLGSGAVLGRRFQPYEAHIPFLLQLKVWWCS
jgi:hypothetical protein